MANTKTNPKRFKNPTMLKLAKWLNSNSKKPMKMNPKGVTIGEIGKMGLGAASAHPFFTGAGALTTGMNIAGLTDNDKFGGQLGGAALGGLISYLQGFNPGYAYLATTAGGALGSLFDKLRAKREQEANLAQQYQQVYR